MKVPIMEPESDFIVEIDPEWEEDYASHVKLEPVDDDVMDLDDTRDGSNMFDCVDSSYDEHSTAVDAELKRELDDVLLTDQMARIQGDHNYCTETLKSSIERTFGSYDAFHPRTEDAACPDLVNDSVSLKSRNDISASISLKCELCRPYQCEFSSIPSLLKHYLEYHRIEAASVAQGNLDTHLKLVRTVVCERNVRTGSTCAIDGFGYRCPRCSETFADYESLLRHSIHKHGIYVTTTGNDVIISRNGVITPGNDVTTPRNDVITPGNDVTTPGNDVTTPWNAVSTYVTTTGNDVITPGNDVSTYDITPGNEVSTSRDDVTIPSGEEKMNLLACATCYFVGDSQKNLLQHFACSGHLVQYRCLTVVRREGRSEMEEAKAVFGCGVCEAYLSSQEVWIRHLEETGHGLVISAQFASPPGEDRFLWAMFSQVTTCPWCQWTKFTGKAALFSHLKSEHGIKGFLACAKCGMLVDGTPKNYSQHFQSSCTLLDDIDIDNFLCPLNCALRFKTFDAFSKHMLRTHRELPFMAPASCLTCTCKLCGKSMQYVTSTCFYRHLASTHKAAVNSFHMASGRPPDEPILPVVSHSSSHHRPANKDNESRTEINCSSSSTSAVSSDVGAILNKLPRICPKTTQETVQMVKPSRQEHGMPAKRVSLRCMNCHEVMNQMDTLQTHVKNCKARTRIQKTNEKPDFDELDPEWEASDSDDSSSNQTDSPIDEMVLNLPNTMFRDHSYSSTNNRSYNLRPDKLFYTPTPYGDHNYCTKLPRFGSRLYNSSQLSESEYSELTELKDESKRRSIDVKTTCDEKRVSRIKQDVELLDNEAAIRDCEDMDVFAPLMMA